jgi:hypothetical protein
MKRRLCAALLSLIAGVLFAATAAFPRPVAAQEPTPVPASSGDFPVLGISPTLCFVFAATKPGSYTTDPLQCQQYGVPASVARMDALFGDGDGNVEPEDFASIDLDGNQVHQYDAHPANNGSMWVVAFVPDADPVRFATDRGVLVPWGSNSPGLPTAYGIDPVDNEYVCDTVSEDLDCVQGTHGGDGVVAVRLRARWTDDAGRGDGVVTVTQGRREAKLRFKVVGEVARIEFVTLESTIQDGVSDLDRNGKLGDTGECPLETTAGGFLGANGTAERSIVLARAFDHDDNSITGAFVTWDTDDHDRAVMAAPLTPTLDLGSFGFGAPNIICGRVKPGDVHVLGKITRSDPGSGATLDPQAFIDKNTVAFKVVGVPASITLVAAPAAIVCDGKTASAVSAVVKDAAGTPAAPGLKVRFDVRVLGTADPILPATNADGVATSNVTPLAEAGAGVPVVATAGGVQASLLIRCGEAGAAPPPEGAAPPPPAEEPPSGGEPVAAVQGAGVPGLPRSGDGRALDGSVLSPAILLAAALGACGMMAAGAWRRRRGA